MFTINEDNSISLTRGDVVYIDVSAEDDGVPFLFCPGDVLRIKVYGKKSCENVVLQKDFPVTEEAERVPILLTEEDTKIGGVISKPRDYWYEVELNPDTFPVTIVGYGEEGPAVFRLFPEGADIEADERPITPEDIPIVDEELDLLSDRPVRNSAITRMLISLQAQIEQSGAGTAEPLIFNVDLTNKTADATFDQIVEAANSGRHVIADAGIGRAYLDGYTDTAAVFSAIMGSTTFVVVIRQDNEVEWAYLSGGVSQEYVDIELGIVRDEIPTDDHINELINTALGVIENGAY